VARIPGVNTFGIGDAAALLGVSADTVRRWVDSGRLAARRDENGRRVVDGAALAAFARSAAVGDARGENPRLGWSSARNRFRGIVTDVRKDTVMAQVEIQAGPYRVVSLMSAEAADELGLRVGVLATAVVKSTNVMVERTEGAREHSLE
jgi:molybdopterin-binding protein